MIVHVLILRWDEIWNDIVTDISSPIRLFADDCLLYREIRSLSNCRLLQRDIDRLVQWSKTWGMEFNVKKSNIISITNATSNKICYQYTMDGDWRTSLSHWHLRVPWCDYEQQTLMERTYRQNQWSCKSHARISLVVSEQMSTTVKGEIVQGYCLT